MLTPDRSDGALPQFPGWVVLEKLGEGGMCAVYRGRPASGEGPERAIKVLTDRSVASVRRFNDEARLLQRIDHPNVVKVHALVPEPLPPWLVMDLLGGRDLDGTMRVEGPMDPERCARMFADLASGLAAVHEKGVRHRDIKPGNIRLGADGVARLIDFGIARDANTTRVTKSGFVVGTASYLPPEIFVEEDANAVQDTEAADVYALGQTLCEALAGKPVHGGKDVGTEATLLVRIMRDKLDREFLDPRDFGARVPEALALLVRRATWREPSGRISTARELEKELRAFLATRTSHAALAPVTRMVPEAAPGPLLPPGAMGAPAAEVRAVTPPPAPPAAAPAPVVEPAAVETGSVEGSSRATKAVAATAAVAGVGAMGVAGVALAVVGVVAFVVLAGAAVWVLNHRPPEAVVARDAEQLRHALAECRTARAPATVQVHVVVAKGRTESARVVGSAPERVSRCVEDVFRGASWSTDERVTVDLPVDFR